MTIEEILSGGWQVIITLAQLASPFALLYVTRSQNRADKKEEKAEKAAEKLEDNKNKELVDAISGLQASLEANREYTEKLSEQLRKYREDNEKLQKSQSHIAMLTRMNGRYTHELAQLVMVIGEGIRDQHLDGNITKAITKYRSFESSVLGDFMSGDDTPGM